MKYTSNQEQYHIHCTHLGMYHYPYNPKCTIEWKHFVISKVDKPTPWCAGIVMVPKKEGAICICVHLKPVNENVLQEVHPLPQGDETLAQLAGAKVFSKMDAHSGFW